MMEIFKIIGISSILALLALGWFSHLFKKALWGDKVNKILEYIMLTLTALILFGWGGFIVCLIINK